MITALIRVTQGPEALAMTLSSLVPAVAEGLVADAVILVAARDEAIARVAEAAGATLVLSPALSWDEGAQRARREWLLCLDDGDMPQEGWIRVLDRFVSLAGDRPDRARFRRRLGLLNAVLNRLRDRFHPSAIRAGDLVHRSIVSGEKKGGPHLRLSAAIERDPVFR
jgi:hypothetical protein